MFILTTALFVDPYSPFVYTLLIGWTALGIIAYVHWAAHREDLVTLFEQGIVQRERGKTKMIPLAGAEVALELLRGQLCDRRQDAEGMGGEEDDVARMATLAARHVVRDEVHRVIGASIVGVLVIGEERLPRVGIENDILDNRIVDYVK